MLEAPQAVLAAFVVFSRVGACLLLMPGFSSPRIPVQARLFIALALSLALTPLLLDTVLPLVRTANPTALLRLMVSEGLTGVTIGALGRLFFAALEAIAVAVAMSIGLSANLGAPVSDDETLPALSSLLTLAGTVLLFVTDQHLEIFRALAASYTALPVPDGFPMRFALVKLTDTATATFTLALRIGSPFLIFSLVTNVAVGLINRLVPSVQVFFLATPFVLIGGLYILYLTVPSMLDLFTAAFNRFLVLG
ncbi:MAG: flagellar type III secretion system protein FliR [Parafilimonas terrae]|nr:flagellar type III secretion system protein FliR [Parafilimonas terrae]